MENGELVEWPAVSVTFTKAEILTLLLPTLDDAIEVVDPLTILASDLIEIRSMIFDRLGGA